MHGNAEQGLIYLFRIKLKVGMIIFIKFAVWRVYVSVFHMQLAR